MAKQRWTYSNTSVSNIGYHLIWCSKFRRNIFIGDIEKQLKELLYKKALELDVTIEKMEVMPDHVHLFIKSSPINAPHFIVRQFKGCTSYNLRRQFPSLCKLPSLWTRSYYCESVGHISEESVVKYIENQKNK